MGTEPEIAPRKARADSPATTATSLAERFREIRSATRALCAHLEIEDQVIQTMPDVSPVKWHLAHTSWFFEAFVLLPGLAGYRAFHPLFDHLFNSYYQTVGPMHPRPRRGHLSRPTVAEIRRYRDWVDRHVAEFLDSGGASELMRIVELGLHHEQQHQELVLMDIKHVFWSNPLRPAYSERPPAEPGSPTARAAWLDFAGGTLPIGHSGPGFSFDNERPRHEVLVRPFRLSSLPVTNGSYLAFMDDGGYERPELWLSDGWEILGQEGWRAPLYWERGGGEWRQMTLSGMQPVALEEPVVHVSYYEADAFARWAESRLPTEQEWEVASAQAGAPGDFVDSARLHPSPCGSAASGRPAQMFGGVWEWTRSSYEPYPGYEPPAGAIGEYNGKFMCNQMVLRGGSCATPPDHVRPTYRNFFYPHNRWQFAGLRLARDPEPA